MRYGRNRTVYVILSAVAVAAICIAAYFGVFVRGGGSGKDAVSAAATETAPTAKAESGTSASSGTESVTTAAATETETEPSTETQTETQLGTETEREPESEDAATEPTPADPSFGTRTDSAERSSGAPGSSSVVIDFVGDLMLANDQNEPGVLFNGYAARVEPGYFLSGVKSFFEEDDFTVGNLENTFTDRNLEKIYKGYEPAYWYCSATKNVAVLTSSSVEVVSLANNHTGDYGEEALSDTADTLAAAGVEYGAPWRTVYLTKDGFTVAVICHGMWGEWDAESIVPRIEEASYRSDFQIVYFHGGTEYLHSPEEWKVRACRRLIDAGADCVIGNHPHVIQPIGRYRGVDIVYSLGNFLAGDFKTCENASFIYRLTINVDGNSFVSANSGIIPCRVYSGELNDFKPVPAEGAEAERIVDFVDWKTDSPV